MLSWCPSSDSGRGESPLSVAPRGGRLCWGRAVAPIWLGLLCPRDPGGAPWLPCPSGGAGRGRLCLTLSLATCSGHSRGCPPAPRYSPRESSQVVGQGFAQAFLSGSRFAPLIHPGLVAAPGMESAGKWFSKPCPIHSPPPHPHSGNSGFLALKRAPLGTARGRHTRGDGIPTGWMVYQPDRKGLPARGPPSRQNAPCVGLLARLMGTCLPSPCRWFSTPHGILSTTCHSRNHGLPASGAQPHHGGLDRGQQASAHPRTAPWMGRPACLPPHRPHQRLLAPKRGTLLCEVQWGHPHSL